LDPQRRREHGMFLHEELRIRIAQRVLELQQLPFGLPKRRGIRTVVAWYVEHLMSLEAAPLPKTAEEDEAFTNLVTRLFEEHTEVIQQLAFGVQDLMADLGPEYEEVQPEVDAALRRFFMARIGLRFLLQHHIESFRNRDGHSGILQLNCDPVAVARKAAQDSAMLCRAHLGQAPPLLMSEHIAAPGVFTYVPMHMHYTLTEIFKNAFRAVVERHAEGFDDPLPPVRCQIVQGYEDVTFRISDEGGGISRTRMQDVWKFMYSTYSKTPWHRLRQSDSDHPHSGDSASNPLQRPRAGGVLAGYGVGLTLSKLYAQYFGGDLKIRSLDGFGTDVYLHLNRLGTCCENLPTGVLYSPSMRDSSLTSNEVPEEELLLSQDELAHLRAELAGFRAEIAELRFREGKAGSCA